MKMNQMIHNLDNKLIVDDQSQLPMHCNIRHGMMYKTYFNRGTQLPRIKRRPSVTISKTKIKERISRTEFHINEIAIDQWFASERGQTTQTRDQLSQTNLTLFPRPLPRREKISLIGHYSENTLDDESESAALLKNN